jgi:hypothetical protein
MSKKHAHQRRPIGGIKPALIVVSLLALAALSGLGMSLYQVFQSHQYVETTGVIQETEYDRPRDKLGETHRERARKRKTVYFNVRYSYQFDGLEYVGDRIQAGTFGWISAANKRDFEQRFPVGAKVPVFVDPKDPHAAVLVRGWSHITTMLSFISGFFVFVTLMLARLSRPQTR